MDQLPIEILCKILSYLKTSDIIQFCKAYGSNCFLKEKSIISSVDFTESLEHQGVFDLHTFITKNFNYGYIKRLNINYMYWIPLSQLRTLINQLKNLEDLYAIGTKLSLHSKDIKEYAKLKKLAISFELVNFAGSEELTALKSLCVSVVMKHYDYHFQNFLRNIPHLEELWIFDEDPSFQSIGYDSMLRTLKNLQKLVIKSKISVRCNSFEEYGFSKTFECRRNGSATELILEKNPNKSENLKKMSIDRNKENKNEVEKSLDMFEISLHDLPYGPRESKQIYIKKSLENVYFEDLNFCQPVILCNSKYINAAIQILSSKNSTKLKRLRFRSCLFHVPQTEVAGETVGGKKSTQGPATPPNSFWTISDNLKELTVLEIETCPGCIDESIIYAYSAIQKFENLHRLSIEVPSLMDGSFLKEVFLKCQRLAYLNLTCVVKNNNFITNLCNNLKYATNLRDFRLEHTDIILDELLDGLNSINKKKLFRIFIDCDNLNRNTSRNEAMPLYRFVQNNPQLIVLVINKGNGIELEKDIKFVANLTKKYGAAGIFNSRFIDQQAYSAHRDIFFSPSNISVININDF